MNGTKKYIADFLTKVEEQSQEAERHGSDEFVWESDVNRSPARWSSTQLPAKKT